MEITIYPTNISQRIDNKKERTEKINLSRKYEWEKKMIRCVYVLLLVTMSYVTSKAGIDYQMSLDNGQIVDSNTFEFNVFIKSMDSTFQLTSYQCSFSFYINDEDGNSLTFAYVPGTSELSNPPSVGIGLKAADGTKMLTFASVPGNDNVSSTPLRVGSFRLQDANSLGGINPNVRWNFEGKLTTILTGANFANITNPSNHIKSFGDLVNYQVVGVTASGMPDANTGPEKTIDGLGYYDGDEYSRWAVQSMPQHIIFDLGTEKSVSMTKFSFYNFQEGRVYQYTISVSDDQVNWNDVVENALSASEEWTVDQFTAVQARYVKLLFLSSTNNPNNWANLWEAQIFGGEQSTSVESNQGKESPENFKLLQNYPNPFNPSTSIEFELKEDSKVKLTIYNVLGEEVAELVNGEINAGAHKVEFNGVNLASGIYVYRLDAGNKFTETKKMVLMK